MLQGTVYWYHFTDRNIERNDIDLKKYCSGSGVRLNRNDAQKCKQAIDFLRHMQLQQAQSCHYYYDNVLKNTKNDIDHYEGLYNKKYRLLNGTL